MGHRRENARGFLPEAQAARAVVSGLLLIWLLAAAFAMGEWNFAGPMPTEGEFATIWQRLDAATDPTAAETQLVRGRR